MRNTRFLAVLTFLCLAVALSAAPLRKGERARRHKGPDLEMLAGEIGLTDEQVQKVKDIQFETEKEAIALRAKIKSAELDFKRLMQETEPDEGQIREKISEVGELKTALRIKQVMGRLATQKVMTPEQREAAKKLQRERRQRRFRRGKMERDPLGGLGLDDDLFGPEGSEPSTPQEPAEDPDSGNGI